MWSERQGVRENGWLHRQGSRSLPFGLCLPGSPLSSPVSLSFQPRTSLCGCLPCFRLPIVDGSCLGLGRLCSIFHPLCYSNMLEIIPIMLETMPQICLLCSNYALNFWKEQMLFVFRNLNRPRANPLSIT